VSRQRRKNDGVRKMCTCARKRWSECEHSWYFNFQWKGQHYRLSLDRELNRKIDGKAKAEAEAERLRTAIREGKFRAGTVALESLTLTKLFAEYARLYLQIHRKATAVGLKSQVAVITRHVLPHPTRGDVAFGEWPVSEITTDTIEQYREARRSSAIAANRDLALLRAMFAWGASQRRKLVADNPFRDGSQAAIRGISAKTERSRRLEPGEAEKLLAVCGPHLRALVEAALETGSPSSGIRCARTICTCQRRRRRPAKHGTSLSRRVCG
jgi:hypothetical protein